VSDHETLLGEDYVASLRGEFSKPDPLGNAAYLTGALRSATSDLCARIYGEDALRRANSILAIYEECKA